MQEGQDGAAPLAVKRIGRIASGYGQSKRVSEHLVLAAQDRGLSASVVRPGTIGPVGGWNDNDTLTKLFRGMQQLLLAPGVAGQLVSVAPVDWVAELVVAAAAVPRAVLNAVGRPAPFEELAPAGLRRVPLADFVGRISRDNALAPLLSYFDNGVFPLGNDGDYVSSTATIQFALAHGVKQCPAWTPPFEHLRL